MSAFSVLLRLHGALGRRSFARAQRLAANQDYRRAFPLFIRAARAGSAEAARQVGRCYLLGLGVPPHAGHAGLWLRQAAAAGSAAAHVQVAELALQGVAHLPAGDLFARNVASHPEPDWIAAEYHAGAAARAGSAEGQALHAFILSEGPQDLRDLSHAEALYRAAANAGAPRAQLGLATLLLRSGDPMHIEEARTMLRTAADSGVAAAFHMLGVLSEGDADHVAATPFYGSAAEIGYPPAQTRYGIALLHGRGIIKNTFAAETWLRRAALNGDAHAASLLGALYAQGDVLAPNPAESRVWLERAAELGHSGAARALAYMLLGRPHGPDRERAEALLRQAAAAGDATAAQDLQRLAVSSAPA